MYIDLHSHTNASDGVLSPDKLYKHALERNINMLAITDHDSVAGFLSLDSAIVQSQCTVIAGIELELDYNPGVFHILGLGIDPYNTILQKQIIQLKEQRYKRVYAMIECLCAANIHITLEDIQAEMHNPDASIGRLHIARALVRQGYAETYEYAFTHYIGNNAPYFIARQRLSIQEGIDLIHQAGGYAVIAHPKTLKATWSKTEQLLQKWKAMGLDGIEICHSSHTWHEARQFARIAHRVHLYGSIGSDFHELKSAHRSLGFTCQEKFVAHSKLLDDLKVLCISDVL